MARICALSAAFAALSCGGVAGSTVTHPDAGADGMSTSPDAEAGSEGGWTQCTAPSGYAVCGGPSLCSATSPQCTVCGNPVSSQPGATDGGLNVCFNNALLAFNGQPCGSGCVDGSVCVAELSSDTHLFWCSSYDLGVLFSRNGGADRVRYADLGAWTGEPLPAAATCPAVAGLEICGGNCGPCSATADVCTGRSPLHPYGFCVPPGLGGPCDAGAGCATAGVGCFVYTVQAAAQVLADQYGMCLPNALCKAAAAGLPGGGSCSPG